MKNENVEKENFRQIPMKIINEKFYKNELEIEDILQNDDCINNLINNKNSRFKNLITSENISKLIKYCLQIDAITDKTSQRELRYPYYSLQILCSSCVLLFEQSIENIKKANNLKKNPSNSDKKELNNNNITSEVETEKDERNEKDNKKIEIITHNIDYEDNFDYDMENYLNKNDNARINQLNELEDIYVEDLRKNSEKTNKRDAKSKNNITGYNKEDKEIINNIVNEIFKTLDNENNNENQTYLGYFQNIVNYILFNESNNILNYLFKDNPTKINILYKYLNRAAIQNILENLLNIISDDEDNEENNTKNFKYLLIISDLFEELNQDNKFDKAEFICELIINTLINNSEKQLIKFFLNNDNYNGLEKIKNIIEDIIDKNNNDKILISIIKLLDQLNNIIMNSYDYISVKSKFKEDLDIFINEYREINTFEYQYICKKNISKKNIFEAYKKNMNTYITNFCGIYNIIKENIKKNNINKPYEQNQKFGLKNLYEWRIIVSFIKLYLFSFYIIENKKENDFNDITNNILDKDLFNISIKLYFLYRKNNLYQNFFIEIIELIYMEKCPKELTSLFLYLNTREFLENNFENEKSKKTSLIDLIIMNLEIESKNKKNNLLIGPDIKILELLMSSKNKEIIYFLKENDLYEKYKDIFNYCVLPKFEKKLNEDYSFSMSEIFLYDNDATFDGIDDDKQIIRIKPLHEVIKKFIEKCKIEKNNIFVIKEEKIRKIVKELNDGKIIEKKSYERIINNVKEKTEIIKNPDINSLEMNIEFSL